MPNFKHGHANSTGCSPTYSVWKQMRQRCCNKRNPDYKHYGGRGISVCRRWNSFDNFLTDMGERPKGKSLDRADNNGNYTPNNCRWATAKEQGDNKRTARLIRYNGTSLSVTQWGEKLGIDRRTIHARLTRGWAIDRILLTQPQHRRTA